MIDHFAYGPWTPVIAYAVSVLGSFIGLMLSVRARRTTSGFARWQWLLLSAVCLGGTAVWSMHFIAMMGFRVSGTPIRYDTPLTLASGAVAVLVMGVALYFTIRRGTNTWLLIGGAIAGSGIVAMHYMGMASMNLHGDLHHDPVYVVAASVIALAAATAALWFVRRVAGLPAITLASLLMGAAVSCMHYTGMFGMSATVNDQAMVRTPEGATSSDLLLPLVVGLFVFLLVCSLFLMLGVEDTPRRPGPDPEPAAEEENTESGEYSPRHVFDPTRTNNR
ncbi:MHYT domain-containing protein [Nocardiopsis flavescens]|uniref:MHYT domain-containing protein, NO-binding membrane sensor n=1 Tax=Nocardiopsis flavescens TaxID=758803 RepID=A0A1M6G6T4_9ACTN|nr:MHYT domain-containing protein [Nocardiopsis flavescens]SHJ05633.1 MHYT domain-containing protein, NO-binding membrane sensor [Nocardiopsis flavescens]